MVVSFSILFKVFGEFEDFFFGGIKREGKYLFDVFEGRVLHVNCSLEFLDFKIEVESRFIFVRVLVLLVVRLDEAGVTK